jgi:2,3-bisphosphoglycerate-independent phosphoglycerate mutase
MSKKVALIILDGWGLGKNDHTNAIAMANTPFFNLLQSKYPNATLLTSGEDVGLPSGQMGNSEVGHLNIGAGRVVYQDLVKINMECRERKIDNHPVLLDTISYVKQTGKSLHVMGLVSDGGVHSSQDHLHHLLDIFSAHQLDKVYVHAFTDGRDTAPTGGYQYLEKLIQKTVATKTQLASITGRYYAMDRDKRWERIKVAYDALVNGVGTKSNDALAAVKASYDSGVTDEFITPIILTNAEGQPMATLQKGDAVICFNFRTDRCREITEVLTQRDFHEQNMHTVPLHYVTMTNYDNSFKDVKVIYGKDDLELTLGEVVARSGKSQIRIAETEKYPHVTFFFSGGREQTFEGERRILVPSPKVATYDLQPEMSAGELTAAILPEIQQASADFICLNFANTDMVGHTGVFDAVVKAVETVDNCLQQVVECGMQHGYSFVIIADHGNADVMINEDGSPHTAHTTNPVPIIVIDPDVTRVHHGRLADVAPTVLKLLQLYQPDVMTGQALI